MSNESSIEDVAYDSGRRAQSEDAGHSLPAPRRRGLASAAIYVARNRWPITTNVLVAASRAANMAVYQDERAFRCETPDAAEQELQGEVQMELAVDQPHDLAAINYCQQGDCSLYNEEALRRRAANRTNSDFVEAVRDWWRWLPKAQTTVLTVVATAAAVVPPPPPVTPAVDDAPALPPQSPSPRHRGDELEGAAGGVGAGVGPGWGPGVPVKVTEVEAVVGSELAEAVAALCPGTETLAETATPAEAALAAEAEAAPVEAALAAEAEAEAEAAEAEEEKRVDIEGQAVDGGSSRLAEVVEPAEEQGRDQSCNGGIGGGGSSGGGGECLSLTSSAGSAQRVSAPQVLLEADVGGAAICADGNGIGGGGAGTVVDWSGLQVAYLDEPIYSAMVLLITWVLLPRFGIRADPEYDPSQDWLDDNEGLPYMDFKHFFDAMFDLADVWSIGLDAAQYVNLIETLLLDVQQLEATQAAFTRLLQKFRSLKRPPQLSQSPQSPLSPPSSPSPPPQPEEQPQQSETEQTHLFELEPEQQQQQQQQQQEVEDEVLMACPAIGHSTKVEIGALGFDSDLLPDPRLLSPAAAVTAAAAAAAAAVTVVPPLPRAPMPQAVPPAVPPPTQRSAMTHRHYLPGTHTAAMMGGPVTAAPTPIVVAFPVRGPSATSQQQALTRLAVSPSRAPSPTPPSEVWSSRRDGSTFKLPQYGKVDVSGVRSPLADYLRNGVPRPDQATLEQWRRRRTSSSRRVFRGDVRDRSLSAQRVRSPTAVALSAELLLGPHGARGSDGGVLMYEEYMHDMAARYLAQQQKVLVATSAGAAAAAGQLLAAASAATEEAAGCEGNQSTAAMDSNNPTAVAVAAAAAAAGKAGPPARSTAGAPSPPSAPHHHPNYQDLVQPLQKLQPQPSQLQQLSQQPSSASTTALMILPPPDSSRHDSASPRLTAADTDSTTLPSALNSVATAEATAAAVMAAAAISCMAPSPRGGGAASSTSPRGSAVATYGSQLRVLVPPPLPPLSAPNSDPHSMTSSPQSVCIVGHAVTVESPPGPGSGSGGNAGRAGKSPLRRQSRTYSPTNIAAAVGDATSETAPTRMQETEVAAVGVGAEQHAASGVVEPDTTGAYAQAEAQAQVVVTFAAAAYRLVDPNVHSLLLPTRLAPSPRDGGLVPYSHSHSQNGQGGIPHGSRSFSGRGGGGGGSSPPMYSPTGRSRPPTATPSAAVPVIQPYLSAALSCMVPHVAAEAASGEGSDGAGWPTATAWPASTGLPLAEQDGLQLSAAAVSPQPTPAPASSQKLSAAVIATTPTSVSEIAAAAAAAAAAASSLGGAVTRRLASTVPSRATPPPPHHHTSNHSPAPASTSRAMGHQLPSGPMGSEPGVAYRPQQPLTDSAELCPTSHIHVPKAPHHQLQQHQQPQQQQHPHYFQNHQAAEPAVMGPQSSNGSSVGGGTLMTRWAVTPQALSAGLVQTPRTTLRPAAAPMQIPGANSVGTKRAGGGSARRFSTAQGLHGASGGGGSTSGGAAALTNATAGAKLRSSYSNPMMAPVAFGDGSTTTAAASNSRRASRSSGYDDDATAATSTHGAISSVPGEASATLESGGAAAGRPHVILQYGSRRRSHTHEQHGWHSSSAAAATAAVDAAAAELGSEATSTIRSPVCIRSSDPVGFADAVTAARMNVAIMADELLQRQAEQRSQAKLLRERTLNLRPSTAAAARRSFPNAFGAFLAAREATGSMAWGPAVAGVGAATGAVTVGGDMGAGGVLVANGLTSTRVPGH